MLLVVRAGQITVTKYTLHYFVRVPQRRLGQNPLNNVISKAFYPALVVVTSAGHFRVQDGNHNFRTFGSRRGDPMVIISVLPNGITRISKSRNGFAFGDLTLSYLRTTDALKTKKNELYSDERAVYCNPK